MPVVCPECDTPLHLDPEEVEAGDTVQCDECGTGLEIVSTDPIEIAPVDETGYDDEGDDARIDTDEEEDE